MLLGFCLLSVWSIGFIFALSLSMVRWHDDGDCRGLVWHTVRNPSNKERYAFWRSKVYIVEDV
jgi:hypothetical protein